MEENNQQSLLKIFIFALLIRLLFYVFIKFFIGNPEFMSFDSWEYFYNSQNLEVWQKAKEYIGYEYWYQRTPAYVLFLYIIRPENAIAIQIIISSLGVTIMYKMNRIAGWLWCLYPISIFNSFQFMKETVYIFLIICLIYILRRRMISLYISILILTLTFASYGTIFNFHPSQGFMRNFYEMWMPSFNMLPIQWNYILFIPYVCFMFYFVRHIEIISFEFLITITFTIVYSIIYAQPRFREPLMPILFLWFANQLTATRYFNLRRE